MTTLSYRIFWEVASCGSFARAAEVMHLTPSAVSHAVASMEKECGFNLFVRGKNGVSLTGSGEMLLPAVQHVLGADETVQQLVDEINGLQKGHVRIGAFSSVCIHWLPNIITTFKEKFPAIDIEIYQGGYDDVIHWLKTGTVDVGFLSESSTREVEVLPLREDRLLCVAPKGFVTKHPGFITLEELINVDFVAQSEGVNADVQNFFKKYHLQGRTRCHVDDDLSTIAMVESGFGICIMPALILQDLHRNVEVLEVVPEEHRTIGLAITNEAGMAPAVKQMVRHICSIADTL